MKVDHMGNIEYMGNSTLCTPVSQHLSKSAFTQTLHFRILFLHFAFAVTAQVVLVIANQSQKIVKFILIALHYLHCNSVATSNLSSQRKSLYSSVTVCDEKNYVKINPSVILLFHFPINFGLKILDRYCHMNAKNNLAHVPSC